MSGDTPSVRQKIKEIKQAGFRRGELGGGTCESCDKNCGRGWWRKVSYEYNEWECSCRDCAFIEIHKYDNFNFEEYMRIANRERSGS